MSSRLSLCSKLVELHSQVATNKEGFGLKSSSGVCIIPYGIMEQVNKATRNYSWEKVDAFTHSKKSSPSTPSDFPREGLATMGLSCGEAHQPHILGKVSVGFSEMSSFQNEQVRANESSVKLVLLKIHLDRSVVTVGTSCGDGMEIFISLWVGEWGMVCITMLEGNSCHLGFYFS